MHAAVPAGKVQEKSGDGPERYPVGVWTVTVFNLILGGLFALLVPGNLQAQVTPEGRVFYGFFNVLSILTPLLLLAVSLSLVIRRLAIASCLQRAAFYILTIRSIALIASSFVDRQFSLSIVSGLFFIFPATMLCWCAWYLMGVEGQRRIGNGA